MFHCSRFFAFIDIFKCVTFKILSALLLRQMKNGQSWKYSTTEALSLHTTDTSLIPTTTYALPTPSGGIPEDFLVWPKKPKRKKKLSREEETECKAAIVASNISPIPLPFCHSRARPAHFSASPMTTKGRLGLWGHPESLSLTQTIRRFRVQSPIPA